MYGRKLVGIANFSPATLKGPVFSIQTAGPKTPPLGKEGAGPSTEVGRWRPGRRTRVARVRSTTFAAAEPSKEPHDSEVPSSQWRRTRRPRRREPTSVPGPAAHDYQARSVTLGTKGHFLPPRLLARIIHHAICCGVRYRASGGRARSSSPHSMSNTVASLVTALARHWHGLERLATIPHE